MRLAIIVTLGLTALSVAVSLQGWRSRLLTSDLWIGVTSAEQFIESGKIPDHGCLSSFGSYIPPGSNMLIIPGVLLFSDQRFYEIPGAALLHLGTMMGLFLLCRLYFNTWCAYVSVALYAVSALGLLFATSLWPRGHPFFTVWFFLFLGDWSIRKSRYALGWALFTWAVGMYYFMELAPLLVAVPIVYFATRPQMSKKAVVFAIMASIFVWAPYLWFESHRGYRDLVSLISRKPIEVGDSTAARSPYPLLDAHTDQPVFVYRPESSRGALQTVVHKSSGVIDALLSNFTENSAVPGSGGALLALCISGLSLAAPDVREWLSRPWRVALAVTLGAASMACLSAATWVRVFLHHPLGPGISAYTSSMGANLLVFLLAMVVISKLHPASDSLFHSNEVASRREVMLFALCFVVAWGAIAMLGNDVMMGRRLWWAWPIHIAFIVFFLNSLSTRIAVSLTLTVLGVVAANHATLDRLRDWRNNGWGGKDPEVLRLLDTVASMAKPGGALSIGYLVAFPAWFPYFHQIDRGYKVGTEFDLYLVERHGIKTLNGMDEGIITDAKYLILQRDVKHTAYAHSVYLSGVSLTGYEEVERSFGYSLLRKATVP